MRWWNLLEAAAASPHGASARLSTRSPQADLAAHARHDSNTTRKEIAHITTFA
jgi:hypothetical protein